MVTALERSMYFDVWAFDDLKGSALGELTEAENKRIHVVDNMPGSGAFRLNRNSAELAMIGTTDGTSRPNLVRVRLTGGGPYAHDSSNYMFAFFIEEGADNIVSIGEEGDEVVELSGRSAEVILERAVIDWESHYVDDIVNHPYDRTALTDGQWHFDENISGSHGNAGSPGSCLRILLRNAGAQVPEPMPEVTHDFNINLDSNGTAWEDGGGRFDLDVGMTLLDALSAHVGGGLWYRFTPALLLRAWDASQGLDVSASVTIEKGVNVREAGVREIHASPVRSRVLVKGSTKKGTLKYRWVTEVDADNGYQDVAGGDIETAIGVRQGFLDYPYSPTNSRLNKAGRKYLADRKFWHDGPPIVGVLDTTGAAAFTDYQPGDTVGLTLPDMPASATVHAIDLVDNGAGTFDPVLTFVGETWAGEDARSSTVTPASSPVGGSSFSSGPPADSPKITVDTTEVLLIWWTPPANQLLVNGSTASGIANSGFAYKNGPGLYTISSSSNGTHFHYIVVSGSGVDTG